MTGTSLHIHAEPLFSTPLVIDRVADNGDATRAIEETLTARGKVARVVGMPVRIDWGDAWPAALAPVIDHARTLASRATAAANGQAAQVDWRVAAQGYEIAAAEHLELVPDYEAYWRYLYIVDDGYGGGAEQGPGGELRFIDPRLPAPMMEAARLRLKIAPGPPPVFYEPEVVLRPGSGSVLMFPGWMQVRHTSLTAAATPRRIILISLVAPLGDA